MLTANMEAGAQGINIKDFDDISRNYGLTQTVPIRRGVTSNVRIAKDFIDLVPFNLVSITGGGTVSSISNGRTPQGKGYIQMNISVPSGQTTGSTITLKVGLSDQFTFQVKHRGLVTALVKAPDPFTVAAGTPWRLTVQGTDLGTPVLSTATLQCHTIAIANRTNTSVQFTLTRSATCAATQYTVRLVGQSSGVDAPTYAIANGSFASFSFRYLQPPDPGLTCASAPNIGPTGIQQPAQGQTLVFSSTTASPRNITIRWDSLTAGQVPAPLNEWIVTRRVPRTSTRGIGGPSIGFTNLDTNVRGLSVALPFTIPGTHTVTIRAKNCGLAAPTASVTFTTAVQ
jgi:hypothetical protein